MQKLLTTKDDLCIVCSAIKYVPAGDRSYEETAVGYSMTNSNTGESKLFDIEIVPGSMTHPDFLNFEFSWLGPKLVSWKRQWFNGDYIAGPILGKLPRRAMREMTFDFQKTQPAILIADGVIDKVNSDDDFSYDLLGFTFHFDFKNDQLKIGKSVYHF